MLSDKNYSNIKNLILIKNMSVFMQSKKLIFILGILLIFISVIGAYAADNQDKYGDLAFLLEDNNESDLTGCCSVACQLDGNNSLFAFRRDAGFGADIFIEKINWHGKEAIKQYKTDGKYFCQVIVTSDGWTVGFGGLDDGDDNAKMENMTADMIMNGTISNTTLSEISQIKSSYGRGHALIKAPDGTYGVATAETYYTGKLNPGDYISVPNKAGFIRTGDIQMNSTDKVKIMNNLEITDGYGLYRRDITTFLYQQVENDTFKGNITDIFASNDDGSTYGMSTGGLFDNININGTLIKGEDLPIAPSYKKIGSMNFTAQEQDGDNPLGFVFNIIFYLIVIILIVIIFVLVIRTINKIRYARRRKRRGW